MDLDRFRFGSAVALGTLPLGLLGVIPGNAPLAVLVVTGLLAFDPDGGAAAVRRDRHPADGAGSGRSDERAPWL